MPGKLREKGEGHVGEDRLGPLDHLLTYLE